jgi:hypothetical protein
MMQQSVPEMRMITLIQMDSSKKLIGYGGEHNGTDFSELMRKGTVKFSRLRLPLDAPLYRDDVEDEAPLLDHFLKLGVVSTVGLPEKLRRGCLVIAEDTETVREIQRAHRIRVFTVILQEVL